MPRRKDVPAKGRERPALFTEEIGTEICSRISQGESLRTICADAKFPSVSTVMRWLADDRFVLFREHYARAREEAADIYAEEIIDIADHSVGKSAAEVNAARLRIDARKWVASKLKPKKYGEKLELGGEIGLPLSDAQLDSRIAGLVSKLGGAFSLGEGGTTQAAGGKGETSAGE